MRYKVIVYYDNMEDSEQVFSNKSDELDYVKSMCDKYISECEKLFKEPPNKWTASAANKSKIKRLGIELRQEMIDLERKYYV